jgi:hypothetical protein
MFVALCVSGVVREVIEPSVERFTQVRPLGFDIFEALFAACFYLLLSGILQVLVVTAVTLILLPFMRRRGWRWYLTVVNRLWEFNIALWLWGSVGNVVWEALTRGMYQAGDPFVEWFAYLPYSSNIYDYDWGSFHGHLVGGATDSQLRTIWGVIAIAVWLATWATLRGTARARLALSLTAD